MVFWGVVQRLKCWTTNTIYSVFKVAVIFCVGLLYVRPRFKLQIRHLQHFEIWKKIFHGLLLLSRFLTKTLRVNTNCHEIFRKICLSNSTLNCRCRNSREKLSPTASVTSNFFLNNILFLKKNLFLPIKKCEHT